MIPRVLCSVVPRRRFHLDSFAAGRASEFRPLPNSIPSYKEIAEEHDFVFVFLLALP